MIPWKRVLGLLPRRCADPKSRSTLGYWNLHNRSTRVQNGGFYFLDPPGSLVVG